jgi:hypothetical protein
MIATEFSLRLAQRVGRVIAHRQFQDGIIVSFSLLEAPKLQALRGKRRTVGDRVGVSQPVR